MALKPNPGIAAKMTDQAKAPTIPIVHKVDLEEHRRLPHVQARLKRVRALMESRAQQNV